MYSMAGQALCLSLAKSLPLPPSLSLSLLFSLLMRDCGGTPVPRCRYHQIHRHGDAMPMIAGYGGTREEVETRHDPDGNEGQRSNGRCLT